MVGLYCGGLRGVGVHAHEDIQLEAAQAKRHPRMLDLVKLCCTPRLEGLMVAHLGVCCPRHYTMNDATLEYLYNLSSPM